MALSAAAYGFLYALLRRLGVSIALASVAALLFTFANNFFLKGGHPQLFGAYFLPVVAYCTFRAIEEVQTSLRRGLAFGSIAAVLLGLLFPTGFYMAWFFGLALLVFVPVLVLFAWSDLKIWWWRAPGRVVLLAASIVAAFIIFLVPFFFIFGPTLTLGVKRSFSEYLIFAPRFSDIVNVGKDNLMWSPLVRALGVATDDRLGSTEASIAITPIVQLMVLVSVLIAVRRRFWIMHPFDKTRVALIIAAAVTCFCIFAFTIEVNSYSIFRFFYEWFPGASAIRAGYRGMIVANLFAVVAIAVAFDRYIVESLAAPAGSGLFAIFAACALIVFAVAEQINLARSAKLSRSFETRYVGKVQKPPAACRTFYVADQADHEPFEVQLDAMLIAMRLGVPTINGYSGFAPPGWNFYDTKNKRYDRFALQWAGQHGNGNNTCLLDVQSGTWTLPDEQAIRCDRQKCFPVVRFDESRVYRIAMNIGGNGEDFTDGRWSGTESWGRWTTSTQAAIAFRLRTDRAIRIAVTLKGLLSPNLPQQYVWIGANGCWVAGAVLTLEDLPGKTISGTLSENCLRPNGEVLLDINTDRASTPEEAGVGADVRHLGVGVDSILISE
jgi:MFS family permease